MYKKKRTKQEFHLVTREEYVAGLYRNPILFPGVLLF